jgi:hypothetical protein
MARRKSRIATIACATDLSTLSRIVESSGLVAERTHAQDHFNIVNSGRILASELDLALWSDLTTKLDIAVRSGSIPLWTQVEPESGGAR